MDELVARRIANEITLSAERPAPQWREATPISFCADWQGLNPDARLQTQVQALWSAQNLFLRFECSYRELHIFDDADPAGRRDHLWDRDVAEAFLQPPDSAPNCYKEFEISPNGMWIDLDIFPGGRADLHSGLKRSVFLDRKQKKWSAELAIPLRAISSHFDPTAPWRANFYRIEGKKEPRQYLAWQPTHTPEPNFHIPSAFGMLRFAAQ
ncbi:MAG TPA: carbohydrate-binding family 9-like protein [Terriglobales bacterium]